MLELSNRVVDPLLALLGVHPTNREVRSRLVRPHNERDRVLGDCVIGLLLFDVDVTERVVRARLSGRELNRLLELASRAVKLFLLEFDVAQRHVRLGFGRTFLERLLDDGLSPGPVLLRRVNVGEQQIASILRRLELNRLAVLTRRRVSLLLGAEELSQKVVSTTLVLDRECLMVERLGAGVVAVFRLQEALKRDGSPLGRLKLLRGLVLDNRVRILVLTGVEPSEDVVAARRILADCQAGVRLGDGIVRFVEVALGHRGEEVGLGPWLNRPGASKV